MFFDEITLSRQSWHYRLQCWYCGKPPFTENFCPYFWLTIFFLIVSVVGSPFYLMFKAAVLAFVVFERIISTPFFILLDSMEKNVCRPMVDNRLKSLSPEDVYKLASKAGWRFSSDGEGWFRNTDKKAAIAKLKRWQQATGDDWQTKLRVIYDEMQKKWEERRRLSDERTQAEVEAAWKRKQERLAKQASRKEFYGKIAKYTKWLVVPLMTVVVVASALGLVGLVGYLLFLLGSWIFRIWSWMWVVKYVLSGIGFILVLIGLWFLARKIFRCLCYLAPKLSFSCPAWLTALKDKISDGCGHIVSAFVAPFAIFVDYIKVFKQNHCPAINWKEDK